MGEQTRRDFLYIATGVAGALGGGAMVWPFIGQMRPDDSILAAASVDVDVSSIDAGMSIVVKWRGQPVVIRHRTAKEVSAAQAVTPEQLKDRYARNPNIAQQSLAHDLARSAGKGRENWLVMVNVCTHLGCATVGPAGPYGGWFCPCHGSVYDTAGRVRSGPADQNLAIPPYQFVSDTLLRIG